MERRRLVRLAHVAGPLGMERVFALDAGVFRFLGLVSLVARIQKTLEDILRLRNRPGVDSARFDDADRLSLYRAGAPDLVTALRENHIVKTASRQQRACGRHAEAHRERNRLLIAVMLGDDLPHMRAGRRLERTHIAPAEVHPVVADVAAAFEILAYDTT